MRISIRAGVFAATTAAIIAGAAAGARGMGGEHCAAVMEAMAGPPMICSPFNIGEAKTLPEDMKKLGREYVKANLVKETLALLESSSAPLVRMETLRRALVIGEEDPEVLRDLLCRLQARVMDQEAREKGDALAWFDAAYMAAAWSQIHPNIAPDVGLAEGCEGYAWMRKALAIGKDAPEMEFAAALATHPRMHKGTEEVYRGHLRRAVAGAAKNPLLERNVKAFCEAWKEPYEEMASNNAGVAGSNVKK